MLPRKTIRGILAVALTVTALPFSALYCGERVLPSGLCALLAATSPLFAVAIAVASHRRRFDRFAVTGIVLGTTGVVLVAGVGAISGAPAILSAGAIVASELGFAWGLGGARSVSSTVPMLQFSGMQQLAGGVALLVFSAASEHRWVMPTGSGVISFLYLVLIRTAMGHTVAIWLAARTNATFASSWSYITPFVALAFGALLLGERIPFGAWIGGGCVIAGAVAINIAPRAVSRRDEERSGLQRVQ